MLDRILKVSKHQAYMIFDDGRIVGLYSDVDVDRIIEIVCPNRYIELDEDTQVIELPIAA